MGSAENMSAAGNCQPIDRLFHCTNATPAGLRSTAINSNALAAALAAALRRSPAPHYKSLCLRVQKNSSLPSPGGEMGVNVMVSLDAFHSAVARVNSSDAVLVAQPMAQSWKVRVATGASMSTTKPVSKRLR